MLPPVWPLPRSLATTSGISVDFSSSPYLDVSVQAVPHVRLFHSTHADRVLLCRVSPFGHLRIKAYLQLPEAFRSLSRPSSAPDAKAFPLRSFQLDLLSCEQERSRSGSHEFELCRLQSSLKLFVLPLKSSTKICCFPLLLALHTLVTLFSFQGASGRSLCHLSFLSAFRLLECSTKTSARISFNIQSMLILFLVVGQSGLEPPTSRLSVVCSSQLSYWPVFGGD